MNCNGSDLRVVSKDDFSIVFEADTRDGDFVPFRAECDHQGCTHIWLEYTEGDDAKPQVPGDYVHICQLVPFIEILKSIDHQRREHFGAETTKKWGCN